MGDGTTTHTWRWTGATWDEVASGPLPPYDPLGATMALDGASRSVVLIESAGGSLTWAWDGSQWRQSGPAPPIDSDYGGTAVLDDGYRGHAIVIGDGVSGHLNRFDVLWMFVDGGWVSDESA